MLTDILIFIAGFLVGALVLWTYGFVTDKLNIAKTGYNFGKAVVIFILNDYPQYSPSISYLKLSSSYL
jgi:hypothetical protein